MTIAISDRIGCDYIQQVRAQLPHAIVLIHVEPEEQGVPSPLAIN